MKTTLAYTTILFYSIFSFVFSAICPALCNSIAQSDACELICGKEQSKRSQCCSQSCSQESPDVSPLAFCSGAYATQNSLRSNCECTVPDRTLAVAELYRQLSHLDIPNLSVQYISAPPAPSELPLFVAEQSTAYIDNVIATTVLRI